LVRVSVIVVNWNTRTLLERCLRSVYEATSPEVELEVIVVDNASHDGSAQMVSDRFPQASLIACATNLGFARANNLAMRRATGSYFLLLNPDAELEKDALSILAQHAEAHPRAAVVGPRLLNSDGSAQSSRRRFPTAVTGLIESTVLQRWMPDSPVLRRYYVLDRGDGEVQETDWLVGACLLVRATAVAEVGLLDEGYFMYSEEMDWCRRFAKAGWKTIYSPDARVVHHGGQSADQDLYSRHVRFQHSKCRYFEKHHVSLIAQALRVHLLGNYLFLLAEDTLKLLLPHKREMRLRRIGTLARVTGWMLQWVIRWGRVEP
jgi:N-acetylglucosaminyl-diphospho-decaprenol L-rhamnosyltransferase